MRNSTRNSKQHATNTRARGWVFLALMYLSMLGILGRLFYWQVYKGPGLQAAAEEQYERQITTAGKRGTIFTADGFPLVTNQQVYRVFAEPNKMTDNPQSVAAQLAPILLADHNQYQEATESAAKEEIAEQFEISLVAKLSDSDAQWTNLMNRVSQQTRDKAAELNIHTVGFDPYLVRDYPEASMAAHLTGFVGKNDEGFDLGYFGIEGALEKELQARQVSSTILTDALGRQLLGQEELKSARTDGRNVTLTLRRDVQQLLESEVARGRELYGASAAEAIVMDPKTGALLGLVSLPKYDQATFQKYDSEQYKNPALSNLYEPGSTFKVLTVSAAIDAGKIEPDTQCSNCDGPRQFGQYTIRTWNDEYHPDTTMTEALANSDNIAMIFAAEQMGAETFSQYLQNFDIGAPVGIELQEDRETPFPNSWRPVELATVSFGQGITANSLQIVKAVAAIANRGVMMRPNIVQQVEDPVTGEVIIQEPEIIRKVISPETADIVTKMMIEAAQHGEAQWIASKSYQVAGKTGTSQVVEDGEYAEDKTIASFIGFAPPEDPKFVMMIKLTEPQSSPWAAETAAPLWYRIANKLYLLFNVQPHY